MQFLKLPLIFAMTLVGFQAYSGSGSLSTLAKYIPKEAVGHAETKMLLDFGIKVPNLSIKDEKNFQSLLLALTNCLLAQGEGALCGAHPEAKESYFDEQGTLGHLVLNRALEYALAKGLDVEAISREALKIKAVRTQELALKAISKMDEGQWLKTDEYILNENILARDLKILGDRSLNPTFRNQTRDNFRRRLRENLFFVDQLAGLKAGLKQDIAAKVLSREDLRSLCKNAEINDSLFGSLLNQIEKAAAIDKLCP